VPQLKSLPTAQRNKPGSYLRHRQKMAARAQTQSALGRELGRMPAVKDPRRKLAGMRSLRTFCESYFPEVFYLPWSADHLAVIETLERVIIEGGLFALAMPRASGKSALLKAAVIWAVLRGSRQYCCLIAAEAGHAERLLEGIKAELETNDRLAEDWPEAIWPIRELEGIHNRAAGQRFLGASTHIGIKADELEFPTIPGSLASGAVIHVAGILGSVRGMQHSRPDGRTVRPDLVLVDDPQTDESARSPAQNDRREQIVAAAILGLAGPGVKISGIMLGTVIARDDMVDRLLDRSKHPEWQGTRTKMIYSFPAREDLWGQYAEIRAEGLRSGRGLADATRFYRRNQKAMDEGAEVAWPQRYDQDEISAIQHALNLKLRDERAFFSEYQNDPQDDRPEATQLSAAEIASKQNGLKRGQVPAGAEVLTLFADLHDNLIYWAACAWRRDFTGWLLDYGTYPKQSVPYFLLRDAKRTLKQAAGRGGRESAIWQGLEAICGELLERNWTREDGGAARIELAMVDGNWQTDLVREFCHRTKWRGQLLPSHGRYYGASSRPLTEAKPEPGEKLGLQWRQRITKTRPRTRYLIFDSNWWKSFLQGRLAVPYPDPGNFSLPAGHHRLLADHLTSEFFVLTEGRGRTVEEWKLRPGWDNHWLDCLVGNCVAASLRGCQLPGLGEVKRVSSRRRVSLSELQRQRRGQ